MSCFSHEAHQHDNPERGREYSLYTKIDFQTLDCLNETVEGSGASVFKPWDLRKDKSKVCFVVEMGSFYEVGLQLIN